MNSIQLEDLACKIWKKKVIGIATNNPRAVVIMVSETPFANKPAAEREAAQLLA
jgi:hypothetical protein